MKTAPETSAEKRIKFENPPVNELVIALFHLPLTELKAQHIGSYWDTIREKYPLCDQQPVVSSPDPQQQPFLEAPGELFPLPRFWFHDTTHPTLIQVQRNAFMLTHLGARQRPRLWAQVIQQTDRRNNREIVE
jgi:uncharacterized protein (TIGR04255 family)